VNITGPTPLTTPLQRLEWLEGVLELAYQSGALARAWAIEDERRYGQKMNADGDSQPS
jgi:hypothetical protein